MSSSSKNRAFWNAASDSYQSTHGGVLQERAQAWGVWRVPEAELRILGDVEGRDVLELGCGAAQWTLALRARGARAVGIDLSDQQLAHARQLAGHGLAGRVLVQGDAERLPFGSGAFDIVFCDHGAISFAAPEKTVAEASRVLRRGGLAAWCSSTPIRDICYDAARSEVGATLSTGYFELATFDDGQSVEYQLPYGAWIRLFRAHGLVVENLVEIQAPPDAVTTFSDFVPGAWARRWPAEHVWKVRKAREAAA